MARIIYSSIEVETLALLANIKAGDPGVPRQDKKGRWVMDPPKFVSKEVLADAPRLLAWAYPV